MKKYILFILLSIELLFSSCGIDERYIFEVHELKLISYEKGVRLVVFRDINLDKIVYFSYSNILDLTKDRNFENYKYYFLYYPDGQYYIFYKTILKE